MARHAACPCPVPLLLQLLLCAAMTTCGVVLRPALGLPEWNLEEETSTPSSTRALLAAATSPAVLQQRALRQAIANASKSPVSFTLTTDIVLTAPLPDLQSDSKVSIIGKCKDRNGKPRSCVIDGAGKHTVFTGGFASEIKLERLIVQNVYGSVHAGSSAISARYVVFRNSVGPSGVVLNTRESTPVSGSQFFRCVFVNNTALFGNGGTFNVGDDPVGGPTLSFTNCIFRNNSAVSGQGGAIYSEGNVMIFRNVLFEGNSALSGGAISTTASAFTAVNTTFAANTARNGRGGAIAVAWNWNPGKFRFCRSTFRSNVANPMRYRSSNNMAFLTGTFRASVGFCPGPAPGGILKPKLISLVRNCTECSGCDGDCYGHGRCVLDPVYAAPSCRCNAFFRNRWSCTDCFEGYTLESKCTQCSAAYYHPAERPTTCKMCPGVSKILEDNFRINSISIRPSTSPLQCQRFCNASQQVTNNTDNPFVNYSNLWIYMAQRTGAPAACAGKCVLVFQSQICGVYPINRLGAYNITYQYLEPNKRICIVG